MVLPREDDWQYDRTDLLQKIIMDHTKVENKGRIKTQPNTSKCTTKCCYSCEEEGHFSRDCPNKRKRSSSIIVQYDQHDTESLLALERPEKNRNLSQIICFECKKEGHYLSDCLDGKSRNSDNNVCTQRDFCQVTCSECKYKRHWAKMSREETSKLPREEV